MAEVTGVMATREERVEPGVVTFTAMPVPGSTSSGTGDSGNLKYRRNGVWRPVGT